MSLAGETTRQSALMTLEAIERTGVRAIIQGWDAALKDASLPATVFHTGSVPHTWLFERVSAVIHHGGFGTTGSTLRAGIPGIVIPHIIDQFFWAQQVEMLGVGPKPIPRAQLTVDKLALAIRQVFDDQDLRLRARTLGEKIQSEPDGVEAAVQWIARVPAG